MEKKSPKKRRRNQILYWILATIFFGIGLVVIFYSGPGRAFLRGIISDVIVVPFLYFLWGALRADRRIIRGGGVLAIAFVLEFLQLLELVGADSPLILKLIFGTTFDPVDLLAYVIGLGLAVAIEAPFLKRDATLAHQDRAD